MLCCNTARIQFEGRGLQAGSKHTCCQLIKMPRSEHSSAQCAERQQYRRVMS